MATSNRFPPIYSTCKFFALLTLTLLLVNAHVVNAQDNTNSTNSNIGNANASTNANANQNGNVNSNVNGNRNQNGAGTSSTPTPTPTPGMENRKDALANSNWFFGLVCLMFAGVLALSGYAIYRAVRYSRTTYNSPLGLPDGSLRAMLAYTLVAFLGFYLLAGILSVSDFKPPEFLLGIVATVIGFYFGSRSADERGAGSTAPKTGAVDGTVKDNAGNPAAGASVDLSQSGVKKLTQTADANGKYKFDSVPVGNYDIKASLTGHAPSDPVKVSVKEGATQTIPLALK